MLLCGKTPFYGSDSKIASMIKSGKVNYPDCDWNRVNSQAISFVEHLLVHDVDKRPTAAEALNHPWLQ